MQDFADKVAVITGAASGIGFALAERCAAERMRVVLADVEEAALERAAAQIRALGATAISMPCDVARAADVEALADLTFARFGGVHLLCNNAGVGGGTTVWESSRVDWEWVFGVNVFGVVNGLRAFVPRMLAQADQSHIVNTGSIYGIVNAPGSGIYKASKHAVVALSEVLYHELAAVTSKVRVSVLCPGFVATRISDSNRNRPEALRNDPASVRPLTEAEQARNWMLAARIAAGTPPAAIADCVFDAVRAERFYILPHPEWKPLVRERMERILDEAPPANFLEHLPSA